jgi:hypothetical protein
VAWFVGLGLGCARPRSQAVAGRGAAALPGESRQAASAVRVTHNPAACLSHIPRLAPPAPPCPCPACSTLRARCWARCATTWPCSSACAGPAPWRSSRTSACRWRRAGAGGWCARPRRSAASWRQPSRRRRAAPTSRALRSST